MYIASMLIKVRPEAARAAEKRIQAIAGITPYGVHKGDTIIAVAEAEEVRDLEAFGKNLMLSDEDVLGVYPTYLTAEEAFSEQDFPAGVK